MEKRYDLIIIGAGPGGYVAAVKAAGLGMKVLVIDRTKLGGTCVNRGCIPTKALIHAASLYSDMQKCSRFGLRAKDVGFDLQKIYEYKDYCADEFRKDIQKQFDELSITFIEGMACIQADKKVRAACAGGEQIVFEAEKILIAAGAKADLINIPGMELPGVMTSEELLTSNKSQYKRLLILGGGVIGLELATVFNELGTEVTVVEASDRLLASMDVEFSDALEEILISRGIRIYKNSLLERVADEGGLCCYFVHNGSNIRQEVDGVLVSVGRSADTKGLFDPEVHLKMANGKIIVNDFFMTSIEGIYAVGDVIGGVKLAHVASAQATYVVERMNNLEPSVMLSLVPSCLFVSMSIIPSCLYTDPEIASVGINEEEAGRKGVPVRCGRYTMSANVQSIISKKEKGFIKVVFAADSDVLLGAQMMCPRATDMIGEFATAIANSLTSRQLMYAMRAHPTFNEAVSHAVEDSRSAGARFQPH